MDSVYDAALAHVDKLKAELEALQNFLNLHDHFRDRFGLTPSAATPSPAPAEADASETEAAAVDQAGPTHEIHVQELDATADDVVEAHAPEAKASEPEAAVHEESLHAEPQAEASAPDQEAAPEEEPLVIQASEGVLIATTAETSADEPLGPEATLQSVADKLAATISATHPSVTGYTV
jgi:hypothetical protein